MGIETTENGVTEEPRPAREGEFVEIKEGQYEGRYGVWHSTTKDGRFATVMTRDNDSENLQVEVKKLKPAQAGRR